MQEVLDHPAIQGGVAPLVVALLTAALLARTRYAWLAIVAGYATMIALSTGFAFSPLTASRKLMLIVLLSPLAGIALDRFPPHLRGVAPVIAAIAGAVSIWVFMSVLQQREGVAAYASAAGIAVFVAAAVLAVAVHREDGLRTGAVGLGLGLATGIAGVISASVGFLIAGVSVAAAAGALLLLQGVLSRNVAPGFTGALSIGVATALVATATVLLAELRWYALPLLLLIPAAVALPVPERAPPIVRAAVFTGYALVAAAGPILVAWYAARGSLV